MPAHFERQRTLDRQTSVALILECGPIGSDPNWRRPGAAARHHFGHVTLIVFLSITGAPVLATGDGPYSLSVGGDLAAVAVKPNGAQNADD